MEDACFARDRINAQVANLKLSCLPDETTVLRFRHCLEFHGIDRVLLKDSNKPPEENDLMRREVTIVDATIISTLGFTKHNSGQCV